MLDLYKKRDIMVVSTIFKDGFNIMKKILLFILAAIMLLSLASCAGNKDDSNSKITVNSDGQYVVGVCQLVEHPALDAATKGFVDTLKAEFGDNIEIIENNAQNDTTMCSTIVSNFVNKKVDLIMANATSALQAAVGGTTSIPILGTSITEYGNALGIDNFSGTVGKNISGTSDLAPLDEQAAMIKELYPDAKTVALLYCSAEPNSEYQVKVIKDELIKIGYNEADIKKYSFADSNDVANVSAKAAECDVIYAPTDNTVANCKGAVNGAIGDTPLIAGESGICSGCGVATLSIDYYDLGVATGKMAIKILKGEKSVTDMPIEYAAEFTKMYNPVKCAQLSVDTAALEEKGYVAIEMDSET